MSIEHRQWKVKNWREKTIPKWIDRQCEKSLDKKSKASVIMYQKASTFRESMIAIARNLGWQVAYVVTNTWCKLTVCTFSHKPFSRQRQLWCKMTMSSASPGKSSSGRVGKLWYALHKSFVNGVEIGPPPHLDTHTQVRSTRRYRSYLACYLTH